ncbi:MAG: mechanosensitive ion channel [Anaerolineae bacterium]|nr:mechanosensitive ion channel [Anaerolineae bacterium]
MTVSLSKAWQTIQEMVNSFIAALPNIGLAIVVFALFYLGAKWVRSAVERVTGAAGLSRSAGLVLGRLSRWLTMGVGLLVALNIAVPSFTTGELIQLLGISSVAIGFAFRDILQNFLAGILLLLTEPFRIGDEIAVSDFEGIVEDVQTRATVLRTYDGRRIVIPNASLFTESVAVNTAFDKRRSEYSVGIGYGDDIGQAMVLVLEAIKGVEGVCEEPSPDVLVAELADFSVNLRARWWTDSRRADVLALQSEVIAAIKVELLENGIDLPFPTQQILFHDQTEETDGDRSRQREGWPAGRDSVPRPRSVAISRERLKSTSARNAG